ncbi:hypothetical protein DPMN_157174 [Dreissena polymorpha]|uniref:Uncharacterized protein n=1 Tax=Dreissena polymorpha TaxID=45954 RepID=A0A9D4EJY5_DREPO|nr:hypothetical protein DPMN_157174 [Dreissena polymorpha]
MAISDGGVAVLGITSETMERNVVIVSISVIENPTLSPDSAGSKNTITLEIPRNVIGNINVRT